MIYKRRRSENSNDRHRDVEDETFQEFSVLLVNTRRTLGREHAMRESKRAICLIRVKIFDR